MLNKKTRAINTPLIIGITLLSMRLLNDFLYDTSLIVKVVDWVYMLEPFNIAFGLCVFLYVRNMIERKATFRKKDFLLLLPLFAYIVYYEIGRAHV